MLVTVAFYVYYTTMFFVSKIMYHDYDDSFTCAMVKTCCRIWGVVVPALRENREIPGTTGVKGRQEFAPCRHVQRSIHCILIEMSIRQK